MAARKGANKDGNKAANMVFPRIVVVVTGLLPPVIPMLSHNREFAYIAFGAARFRAFATTKLPQACETTASNTVAAAIKPELIHPGVMKYFREIGVAK
jgi:hypothetical protein